MSTGKALDGKSYEGNPHVRFDEGEVAPCTAEASLRRGPCRRQPEGCASRCAATPRRGSLLYVKDKLGMVRKAVFSSLLVCAFIPAAAEVPFCALRFGYRFTQPDKWPKMRAALEKNRPAFDEVWFSTGVSFPSLAWHEEHARQCAKAADDLRKLGIIPSIEIQTIIGHGDDLLGSVDCSGQDWGTMVCRQSTSPVRAIRSSSPTLSAWPSCMRPGSRAPCGWTTTCPTATARPS